jgi:hypothetical protein
MCAPSDSVYFLADLDTLIRHSQFFFVIRLTTIVTPICKGSFLYIVFQPLAYCGDLRYITDHPKFGWLPILDKDAMPSVVCVKSFLYLAL